MKRHVPMTRSKPLRSRSKKTEARYSGPTGRRALVARLLREFPHCQAHAKFWNAFAESGFSDREMHAAWGSCERKSRDVHELLARSAGGDILDENNLICVCRSCHTWIGDHPRLALALGLRRSRYARGAA